MEKEKTTVSLSDLVLTPDWARQPPSSQKNYTHGQKEEENKRADKRKERKANTPSGSSQFIRLRKTKERDSFKKESSKYYPPDTEGKTFRGVRAKRIPVSISFIPERRGLKALVMHLSKSLIAYPLLDIAAMFLTKHEYYDVKYETGYSQRRMQNTTNNEDAEDAPLLFQCTLCKQLFIDKSRAEQHIFVRHFNEFFDVEERQVDPPKGNFICVAKCSLNGDMLCPPNYHEFNEKLLELHRAKFSNMALEEFRKTIINVPDASVLEQWKKEASVQRVYKLKPEKRKDNSEKEFSKKTDAELFVMENYMSALIKKDNRFVIPGSVAVSLEDHYLASLTQNAFERENRSPVRIAAAIYPAFRNLGMKTFKRNGRITYVSGVEPNSNQLEPEQTTGTIRQILEWMNANPDKPKADMLNAIVPNATPESPAYVELVSQLRWLIERGYIIEFSNGNLSMAIKKYVNDQKETPQETNEINPVSPENT
jgi:hypothetical protein